MGWQQTFQIPLAAQSLILAGKEYSWDVIYLGAPQAGSDSQIDWNKVSHVTRNVLKF